MIQALYHEYASLPTTATPSDFLRGEGNWGLTEDEYDYALFLAMCICGD